MDYHLIVREPFGSYAVGVRIEDTAEVAAIVAGENRSHVIPIAIRHTAPTAEVTLSPAPVALRPDPPEPSAKGSKEKA